MPSAAAVVEADFLQVVVQGLLLDFKQPLAVIPVPHPYSDDVSTLDNDAALPQQP